MHSGRDITFVLQKSPLSHPNFNFKKNKKTKVLRPLYVVFWKSVINFACLRCLYSIAHSNKTTQCIATYNLLLSFVDRKILFFVSLEKQKSHSPDNHSFQFSKLNSREQESSDLRPSNQKKFFYKVSLPPPRIFPIFLDSLVSDFPTNCGVSYRTRFLKP